MPGSRWAYVTMLLLLATIPSFPPAVAQSSSGQPCAFGPCGPNVDQIVYSVAPLLGYDQEVAYLKNHQIDMIQNIRSIKDAENLATYPNIRVYKSPAGSFHFASLFFNCRRSPFDDGLFRNAFSHLVNGKYIAEVLLDGWAEPSTTFVPPASDEWTNYDASVPQFSFRNATTMFDKAGYALDSQTGTRLNPRTGAPLRQITLLTPTRSENPDLWAAGEVVAYYANAAGIQTTHATMPDYLFVARTMRDRDYDILIADIALAAAPFGLYALFHSSRDGNWTLAYSGIHDLILDRALETLWSGTTKSEALRGARDAQARLAYLLPYVPIYSIPTLTAVSSDWTGVANMRGYGVVNPWTYLNLSRAGAQFGGKFTQSVEGPFTTLNPALVSRTQEWRVLELLYSPLFSVDPVTSHDLPVLAKEWVTETWSYAAGKEGMKITFKLRDDVRWQDGQPFTASDVKFTIEYLQSNKVPQYLAVLSDVMRVEAPDPTTLQIYISSTGYRHVYDFAWMTFLPEHVWSNVKDYKNFKPWEEPNPSVKGLTKLVGQGPFIFAQGDLKKSVTLAWNPLYFGKNPQKPGLVERQLGSLNASAGQLVNVQYEVLNYTRGVVSDPQATFRLIVSKDDKILLDLPTSYSNGLYTASIDTGKIGSGEYACEFNAAPYGLDKFTIEVSQSTVSQSAYLYGLAGGAIVVVAVCIYLATKRTSRKRQVKLASGRTSSNRAPKRLEMKHALLAQDAKGAR